ncbi:MAG: hypothetical protein ACOCX1_00180 [Fimbriimonadaceae bacterium]
MNPKQRKLFERIRPEIERYPLGSPPSSVLARDLRIPPAAVEGVLQVALKEGDVLRPDPVIWITPRKADAAFQKLKEACGEEASIAQVRDLFDVSRKYAEAFLHLAVERYGMKQHGLRFTFPAQS